MPTIEQSPLYTCSVCGKRADTQIECHGLMEESGEFTIKTTLSQAELEVERMRGAELEANMEIQNEQKRKEGIYKQIGELMQIQNVQIQVDGRYDVGLDRRIKELKKQLNV